jgi:hypothetical protein
LATVLAEVIWPQVTRVLDQDAVDQHLRMRLDDVDRNLAAKGLQVIQADTITGLPEVSLFSFDS